MLQLPFKRLFKKTIYCSYAAKFYLYLGYQRKLTKKINHGFERSVFLLTMISIQSPIVRFCANFTVLAYSQLDIWPTANKQRNIDKKIYNLCSFYGKCMIDFQVYVQNIMCLLLSFNNKPDQFTCVSV